MLFPPFTNILYMAVQATRSFGNFCYAQNEFFPSDFLKLELLLNLDRQQLHILTLLIPHFCKW